MDHIACSRYVVVEKEPTETAAEIGQSMRSPCSVMRMIRIDSSTLGSSGDQTTRPSEPTRGGKLIPLPKNLPKSGSRLYQDTVFFALKPSTGRQVMK